MGCHALLQGIFSTQGSNLSLLCLLHCRQSLYCLNHQGGHSPSSVSIQLTVLQPFETGDIPILQMGKLRQGRTGNCWKSAPGTKQSLDTGCGPCLPTRSTPRTQPNVLNGRSVCFSLYPFGHFLAHIWGPGSDRGVTPAPKGTPAQEGRLLEDRA